MKCLARIEADAFGNHFYFLVGFPEQARGHSDAVAVHKVEESGILFGIEKPAYIRAVASDHRCDVG